MNKLTGIGLGAVVALAVVGCAKNASDIGAAYISPMQYSSYNCSQLREEATRVSSRAIAVIGAQDSKATRDAVATTVGVIVFWPALFFIRGDGATAAEVARLKGTMEAIESASIRKKCGIEFKRAPKPKVVEQDGY